MALSTWQVVDVTAPITLSVPYEDASLDGILIYTKEVMLEDWEKKIGTFVEIGPISKRVIGVKVRNFDNGKSFIFIDLE